MSQKQQFTPEYKKEIVRLVTEQGKSISEVARDLSVSPTALRNWVKLYGEHGEQAFPGKGHLRPEDEELRKLKKKLADLEEENAILKKAMAIFAKPGK